MDLRDALVRNLEDVTPDATLREAAEKMRQLNTDTLPVCDHDDFVGIISEHDITTRAVAEGRDPNSATVRDAMCWQLFYFADGC